MVSLGWTGILVPEEYGGSNFGVAGISSILEELGSASQPLYYHCCSRVSLVKHAKEIKKEFFQKLFRKV